ncbi:MAG TPA: hydroxymyristoyl-ACP dehydratase [Clostridiales bacterium]|nr:hydroxymyristoyl-ACP dehydratase [Clostridium sp.]MEE1379123.1 hydroxymyristoyl-ACP dehydratase [Clostridia bacterium]HCQ55358.1 hydroxymyristoyl-ACP dehydratase [Clostridiales bacterium]
MTNINCCLNCVYQKDGKCSYDIISNIIICSNSECAYYKSPN